jgi:transposase
MGIKTKLKRYDKEFKAKAIKLALSSPQSISQIAEELGVKAATLYSWVKNKKNTDIETHGEEGKNFHDELARLRKENARLREEREILKKAAAFFAKESH